MKKHYLKRKNKTFLKVRGIIITKPRIITNQYNDKDIVVFSITYKSKGKDYFYKVFFNCNEYPKLAFYFTSKVVIGDIWTFSGYLINYKEEHRHRCEAIKLIKQPLANYPKGYYEYYTKYLIATYEHQEALLDNKKTYKSTAKKVIKKSLDSETKKAFKSLFIKSFRKGTKGDKLEELKLYLAFYDSEKIYKYMLTTGNYKPYLLLGFRKYLVDRIKALEKDKRITKHIKFNVAYYENYKDTPIIKELLEHPQEHKKALEEYRKKLRINKLIAKRTKEKRKRETEDFFKDLQSRAIKTENNIF